MLGNFHDHPAPLLDPLQWVPPGLRCVDVREGENRDWWWEERSQSKTQLGEEESVDRPRIITRVGAPPESARYEIVTQGDGKTGKMETERKVFLRPAPSPSALHSAPTRRHNPRVQRPIPKPLTIQISSAVRKQRRLSKEEEIRGISGRIWGGSAHATHAMKPPSTRMHILRKRRIRRGALNVLNGEHMLSGTAREMEIAADRVHRRGIRRELKDEGKEVNQEQRRGREPPHASSSSAHPTRGTSRVMRESRRAEDILDARRMGISTSLTTSTSEWRYISGDGRRGHAVEDAVVRVCASKDLPRTREEGGGHGDEGQGRSGVRVKMKRWEREIERVEGVPGSTPGSHFIRALRQCSSGRAASCGPQTDYGASDASGTMGEDASSASLFPSPVIGARYRRNCVICARTTGIRPKNAGIVAPRGWEDERDVAKGTLRRMSCHGEGREDDSVLEVPLQLTESSSDRGRGQRRIPGSMKRSDQSAGTSPSISPCHLPPALHPGLRPSSSSSLVDKVVTSVQVQSSLTTFQGCAGPESRNRHVSRRLVIWQPGSCSWVVSRGRLELDSSRDSEEKVAPQIQSIGVPGYWFRLWILRRVLLSVDVESDLAHQENSDACPLFIYAGYRALCGLKFGVGLVEGYETKGGFPGLVVDTPITHTYTHAAQALSKNRCSTESSLNSTPHKTQLHTRPGHFSIPNSPPRDRDTSNTQGDSVLDTLRSAKSASAVNATGNLIDFDDGGYEWCSKIDQNESDYTRLQGNEEDETDEVHMRTNYLFDEDKAMTLLSQMQTTKHLLTEAQRIAYVEQRMTENLAQHGVQAADLRTAPTPQQRTPPAADDNRPPFSSPSPSHS
ncbi:hypothetical protein B0H16DRAFT_1469628 [Mycena metata]|uniref:Uncharacterized protein n=1 Tax=Mycena metata TaxID=1033252 RepID=A0AAD7MTW0_9AGAR|nr:hypothetical protein B0H16DRAFT_1469628 [Mycena metata]